MKQIKQNKTHACPTPQQHRHTHTHTHTPLFEPKPLTTQQTEFKILITPGVLKRNGLDLIGFPGAGWF